MASKQNNEMIEITGLWRNVTQAGKEYFKGYMGQAQVFIFFNENKTSEKAPDARLLIAPKKDDRNQGGYQRGGNAAPSSAPASSSKKNPDDDIPF